MPSMFGGDQLSEDYDPVGSETETVHIDTEDCQGHPQKYWDAYGKDIEGKLVLASASTRNEAKQLLREKLQERNAFLQSSPAEQLNAIVEKDRILSEDMERAIRLIHKLLPQPQRPSNEERLKKLREGHNQLLNVCEELLMATQAHLEPDSLRGQAENEALTKMKRIVKDIRNSTGM